MNALTAEHRTRAFDDMRPHIEGGWTGPSIAAFDRVLDYLGVPRIASPPQAPANEPSGSVSAAGIALIHQFESCARSIGGGKFTAYPDPGSRNGVPWTIGLGSTGADIGPGTIWTKAQCDARFARDIERYAAEVRKAIGSTPTTQHQFDALVSFHYNTGAIASATLTKKHRAGEFNEAARQFGRWIYNDGRKMAGLVRRRAAEAAMYRGEG